MTAQGRSPAGQAPPERRPKVSFARVIFVTLVGYGGYLLAESLNPPGPWLAWALGAILAGVLAGFAVLELEHAARQVPLPRLFVGALGALAGLLLAQLLGPALVVVLPAVDSTAGRGFLALLLAYLGVVFALRREEELGGLTRAVFPSATPAREQSYKVLDTSVIIDGRIADVCETGFLEGTLLIPQYVLRELHQIADSSDPLKRNRGRRGLDVLQKLQRMPNVTVELHDLDFPHIREVDRRLIETARAVSGTIVTNDYNLNKVAALHGVRVLNVNELANALRPVVLPGELLQVHILREGKEAGQGVGYLEDGTMVVIDQGKKVLGQTVTVAVTSVLQTSAGRMIFTRLGDDEGLLRPAAGTRRCAVGPSQGVGRVHPSHQPRRRDAEENSREQANSERETQHRQRRHGTDRHRLVLECELQDQARPPKREGDPHDPPEKGQGSALDQHLHDLPRARRAQGGAKGNLLPAARRPHQHEIRDVGAGDQQDEAGDPEQQMQARLILIPHHLDSCATGRQMQRLLRDQRPLGGIELGNRAQEPLPQFHLQAGLDGLWIGPGGDAADQVEPIRVGKIQQRRRAVEKTLRFQRKPERGRILQPVAVERGRRDAHYGERLTVESERRPEDRRVHPILPLPGAIAHDGNRFGASPVIFRGEHPPYISADAEHREVVPGDVLGSLRLSRLAPPDAAYSRETVTSLKRRELAEPGCPVTEGLVFVVREERPVVLQAPVDTAILVVADPIQLAGPGYRQGLQQHRVHQSEDGGGRADPQRQRQHGRGGKPRSVNELPYRITQVFCESHVATRSRAKRRLSLFGELPSNSWLDDGSETIVAKKSPMHSRAGIRALLLPCAERAHPITARDDLKGALIGG